MNKLSVKIKVTLWYAAVMIVVSAIVLFAMTSINSKIINRDVSNRLIEAVDDNSRQFFEPGAILNSVVEFKHYDRGVSLALYDGDGDLIGGNLPFEAENLEFKHSVLRSETYGGETFYVLDKMVFVPGGYPVWVKGAISITAEKYALNSALTINFVLTGILILIASIGGYLIIKRAFVPVNKITDTAQTIIRSDDLSKRIDIGDGKDEISNLANTFDEMLDHIENAFEREKQFTSDASHELRTPVSVILSECEYMSECAKTDEEYKESAESVKIQAEKMAKLISQLLMISRMDRKSLQLNFEKTDISELLNFVCDEQENIREKNVRLIREIDDGITAQADRFMIARLFMNLISNAYQYIGDGDEIRVSLKEAEDKIIATVWDNGKGIAKEDIDKIWERFYQADASRIDNKDGSAGLGLSMVKWIAQVHNGDAYVQSELGVGSEFKFVMNKNN
ncbi:MAG: ATP-binding protein [Eubacteriales bacterium]|nr:ATP-binding protein [Eubacteriales bacterium]